MCVSVRGSVSESSGGSGGVSEGSSSGGSEEECVRVSSGSV